MSALFCIYFFLAGLTGLIWFMSKMINGEYYCLPLSVFTWWMLDNTELRLIPKLILALIVAIIDLPGFIVTLVLMAVSYVVMGVLYIFPWLCCKDRTRIAKDWAEHWKTNPFTI